MSGSGAGGALIAWESAKRGLNTLVVERGPYLRGRDMNHSRNYSEDVAAVVAPLLARNANSLAVNVASDSGSLEGDVTKMRQILLNLLSNAAKFTREGTKNPPRTDCAVDGAETALLSRILCGLCALR